MDRVWLRRIISELAAQRSRTTLTVLSIAVGLFAVSLTFRTEAILSRNVLDIYHTSAPPALIVELAPADPQLASMLRGIDGVRGVEGVLQLTGRARVGESWRAITLSGVRDPAQMEVSRLLPEGDAQPLPRRSMLIERSFVEGAGVRPGAPLKLELDNGRLVDLPVAGAAQDMAVVSGRLGNPVLQGYISLDTAAWLNGSYRVNTFLIAVDDGRDQAGLRALADTVRARLEDAGCAVTYVRVRDPSAPEVYSILNAVFQMLSVLGLLSLTLSAFLVVNTTSAMLTRHVPQIGVMKAIGGSSGDIFRTYLSIVLAIALLAMLVALPSAAICAWLLAERLAWLINYDLSSTGVPTSVVGVELAAGLMVPLLVSAYPVRAAARLTVLTALRESRGGPVGVGKRNSPVPGVPIALLYAVRSMFRRKARLLLTLASLIAAATITITVLSTQASLFATLDQVADYWQQDLTMTITTPKRADRIVAEALEVPGVVAVERQPATLAVRQRPGGGDSELRYAIFGVEPDSALIRPTVVQGRWLRPDDDNAIVINVDLLKREPDLAPGALIELGVGGRASTWRVVGVATNHLLIYGEAVLGQGVGYVSAAAFQREIYGGPETNRVVVTTASHDAAERERIGQALEDHFARLGVKALVQTQSEVRQQITGFVSLIIVLLLVMALSFAAIGALSLVGAMSLNVLERTKEVGILRAIGSSHRQITLIVVSEGICIGLLSWVPATLLALPLSRLLSDLLGWSMLSWPLVYRFPPQAPLLCAALIIILAAGASYIPARRAARINVRGALEYL